MTNQVDTDFFYVTATIFVPASLQRVQFRHLPFFYSARFWAFKVI